MYLARYKNKGRTHYVIRESFKKGDRYLSRNLFDLGSDPSQYIVYLDDRAYYIDDKVTDTLHSLGIVSDGEELDDIFWQFLDPEIKRTLKHVRQRATARTQRKTIGPQAEKEARSRVHIMDLRRIHYLKFGQIDQRNIRRMPVVLFEALMRKSRDEIEQSFMAMEQALKPSELKEYVYVIFNLQRFFSEIIATKMPQGLDQDNVDRHFLEEICRLNKSKSFWAGLRAKENLHDYLVRYVIMFFDNDFDYSTFLEGYARDFINRHRQYRPPKPKETISDREASTIFGLTKEILKNMNQRSLARMYRRLAQKFHPDTGGAHDKFIKLTEAYQKLKKSKEKKR